MNDVRAIGGSVLEAGRPYLVGSLAQGFGNHKSDIDIHLFVDDLDRATAPYLFFVGDVPVDVEHIPSDDPVNLVDSLDTRTVEMGAGHIAVASVLTRRRLTQLTRWLTALPMSDNSDGILTRQQQSLVYPHLMRYALRRVVLTAALAETIKRASKDSTYAWRLCGRALLDLSCTVQGLPPIGQKWLPARLRRADIPAELIDIAHRVQGLSDVELAASMINLKLPDVMTVAAVVDDPDISEVRLGRELFTATAHGRLELRPRCPEGPLSSALKETAAEEIVDLISAGLIRIEVDDEAFSRDLQR